MHTQEHTCIWAQHCRILIKSAALRDDLSIKWNKLTLILSSQTLEIRYFVSGVGLLDYMTQSNITTRSVSILGNLNSYYISIMKLWFLWSGHVASMVWMRNYYSIVDRRTPGDGTSETWNRWKDNINKIDLKIISAVFPLMYYVCLFYFSFVKLVCCHHIKIALAAFFYTRVEMFILK